MKFPLTPEPLPNDPAVCTIEVAALLFVWACDACHETRNVAGTYLRAYARAKRHAASATHLRRRDARARAAEGAGIAARI